jgi:hypothetical protein
MILITIGFSSPAKQAASSACQARFGVHFIKVDASAQVDESGANPRGAHATRNSSCGVRAR